MTAEKVTMSRVSTRKALRQRRTILHSAKARTKQARAAIRVPRGACWRKAIANRSARGAWWRKGRMMKAGIKKRLMAAKAQRKNMVQTRREAWGCVWKRIAEGEDEVIKLIGRRPNDSKLGWATAGAPPRDSVQQI